METKAKPEAVESEKEFGASLKKEKKMEKDDLQPMVRVKTKSGMIYYPKFENDTEGKWRPVDPSFQKMNRLRYNSEMRVNMDK